MEEVRVEIVKALMEQRQLLLEAKLSINHNDPNCPSLKIDIESEIYNIDNQLINYIN